MCGRFALHLRHNEIRAVPGHNMHIDEWVDEEEFVPRYNIAPRTRAPVIRRVDPSPSGQRNHDSTPVAPLDSAAPSSSAPASGISASPKYILHSMKWGLVPHWSKHEDKSLSTTNARAENLVEGGGMWQSIKGKKRCALVAEGYYEWLTKGKDKLPHFTKHRDGRVMLLAGLYDCTYLEGSDQPLWTFTIVTTAANKKMSWLHDRQPVILSTKDKLDAWLDTSSQSWSKELSRLVEPYQDETGPLECYPVPKEVGKVGVESPTFIEPVSQRKDGIEAMFSRQSAKTLPAKRKRSSSPVATNAIVDLTEDGSPLSQTSEAASPHKKKRGLTESLAPSPSKGSPSKKKIPPLKGKAGETPKNVTNITSFFAKR